MARAVKVERLELVHLRVPLVRFLETGFGRFYEHETLIVRAESGGAVGYGEVPAGAAPAFSYETVQTAWHVIRDFLARKLKGQEIAGPGPISDLFAAVRGHNMAKAGIEMAVLDLLAGAAGRPMFQVLGGERAEVPVGVSLGIEDRVEDLLKRVERSIERGYQRIKVRIRPGWDVSVLAEIRKRFPVFPLVADAVGAYRLSDADHLKRLDEYGLMALEQPLDVGDLADHAKLQAQIRTPICLDESVGSFDDARRAMEMGSCRIISVKPSRVGGLFAAKMIHSLARAKGIPAWCGGPVQTGVGRAHDLAAATLPHFSLPGDIQAGDHHFREDVVDPPLAVTPRGTVGVPQGPGIGFNVLEARLGRYCVRREYVLS